MVRTQPTGARKSMPARPMMNRCATCGQEWWDAHACPKQAMKDGRTLEEVLSTLDGWPKLTKPARVGNGTFGVGVSARLVVEAAQRQHEYHAEDTNGDPPMKWEPLYDQAALDAAVQAERKRCVKICDAVTVKMSAECPSAVNGWWPDQVGYACIQAIQGA